MSDRGSMDDRFLSSLKKWNIEKNTPHTNKTQVQHSNKPQVTFGKPQATFGKPQATFGKPQATFGKPQATSTIEKLMPSAPALERTEEKKVNMRASAKAKIAAAASAAPERTEAPAPERTEPEKKKRVLTPEHLAKMKAGRERKKAELNTEC